MKENPFRPIKIYPIPIMEPNLTLAESDFRYLARAGSISLAKNAGFKGVIKLREQAAILFTSRSQWRSF